MSTQVSGASTRRGGCERTIDVAEATGFALLGMVKASSPVDRNVALLTVQARGALHAATSTDAAELEETIKDGTVVADVVLDLLLLVAVHVVGGDALKEVDVLVGVELGHLAASGGLCALL